ncbi:MAG: (d)CMP kinase [Clostridioides sp.]|nr:(d)CMP kinase [Clostridioides sp.]
MDNVLIAVDGPAGAGKSTIAKIVAQKLNINYIDTGAMYRAVTYKCLQNGVDIEDEGAVVQVAKNTDIDFKDNNIYLDGNIINEEIRTVDVSNKVSKVSKIGEVREILVDVQRKIGSMTSAILDGRDIGSIVFPNAEFKFYLIASPEERGLRRFKEMKEKGYEVDLSKIVDDIVARDEMDMNREHAPLVRAHDAVEIDTTGKSIDEVVCEVVSHIQGN